VDLNSLLLIGRRNLAWMARELGRPEKEAEEWESMAETTEAAILKHHYSEEKNRFYDRDVRKDQLRELLTPASFYPLWAGVSLEKQKARQMIEDALLHPGVLGGSIPFPTVARDEQTFTSDGYWRGPVWINQAYVLYGVLVRYGYTEEARKAREALLALNRKNDWIWEYYDAETGRGHGVPEYGWSAALFMEMVLEEAHLP
jgi:putative isomerase